jgi:hypothetical protein
MLEMKKIIAIILFGCSLQAIAGDVSIITRRGSLISLPGYRTYTADIYSPAEKNIELLNELKKTTTPIKISAFTATTPGISKLVCRASYPVNTPDKIAFESFIEGALRTEFSQTGLGTEDAPRQIQAHLDEFDFSSFGTGKWTIKATFTTEGKEPVVIKHEYTYPLSFAAGKACGDVTNALVPAVQSFLFAAYSDPHFVRLIQ